MVKPIPDGYHTVTPYLTASDLPKLLEFLKNGLHATITEAVTDAEGKMRHAEARIGDSMIMMGQEQEHWRARPGTLYLYVENADEWYQRAMSAGAKSLMEPADMFYGDRNAGVEDPIGNYWWFATHVEDVAPEEMERRATQNWKKE